MTVLADLTARVIQVKSAANPNNQRRVRTPAGQRFYGQPIGTVIHGGVPGRLPNAPSGTSQVLPGHQVQTGHQVQFRRGGVTHSGTVQRVTVHSPTSQTLHLDSGSSQRVSDKTRVRVTGTPGAPGNAPSGHPSGFTVGQDVYDTTGAKFKVHALNSDGSIDLQAANGQIIRNYRSQGGMSSNAPKPSSLPGPAYKAGDHVTTPSGRTYQISNVHPNGNVDITPVGHNGAALTHVVPSSLTPASAPIAPSKPLVRPKVINTPHPSGFKVGQTVYNSNGAARMVNALNSDGSIDVRTSGGTLITGTDPSIYSASKPAVQTPSAPKAHSSGFKNGQTVYDQGGRDWKVDKLNNDGTVDLVPANGSGPPLKNQTASKFSTTKPASAAPTPPAPTRATPAASAPPKGTSTVLPGHQVQVGHHVTFRRGGVKHTGTVTAVYSPSIGSTRRDLTLDNGKIVKVSDKTRVRVSGGAPNTSAGSAPSAAHNFQIGDTITGPTGVHKVVVVANDGSLMTSTAHGSHHIPVANVGQYTLKSSTGNASSAPGSSTSAAASSVASHSYKPGDVLKRKTGGTSTYTVTNVGPTGVVTATDNSSGRSIVIANSAASANYQQVSVNSGTPTPAAPATGTPAAPSTAHPTGFVGGQTVYSTKGTSYTVHTLHSDGSVTVSRRGKLYKLSPGRAKAYSATKPGSTPAAPATNTAHPSGLTVGQTIHNNATNNAYKVSTLNSDGSVDVVSPQSGMTHTLSASALQSYTPASSSPTAGSTPHPSGLTVGQQVVSAGSPQVYTVHALNSDGTVDLQGPAGIHRNLSPTGLGLSPAPATPATPTRTKHAGASHASGFKRGGTVYNVNTGQQYTVTSLHRNGMITVNTPGRLYGGRTVNAQRFSASPPPTPAPHTGSAPHPSGWKVGDTVLGNSTGNPYTVTALNADGTVQLLGPNGKTVLAARTHNYTLHTPSASSGASGASAPAAPAKPAAPATPPPPPSPPAPVDRSKWKPTPVEQVQLGDVFHHNGTDYVATSYDYNTKDDPTSGIKDVHAVKVDAGRATIQDAMRKRSSAGITGGTVISGPISVDHGGKWQPAVPPLTHMPTGGNVRQIDSALGNVSTETVTATDGSKYDFAYQMVPSGQLKAGDVVLINGQEDKGPLVVTKLDTDSVHNSGNQGVYGKWNGTGNEEQVFLAQSGRESRVRVTPVAPDPPVPPPPPGSADEITRNHADLQSFLSTHSSTLSGYLAGSRRGGYFDTAKIKTAPGVDPAKNGDQIGGMLLALQGYQGLPHVADTSDIDSYVTSGEQELWRGVNGSGGFSGSVSAGVDPVENFIAGDFWPGNGVYGNGTYAAAGPSAASTANSYGSLGRSRAHGTGVFRMTLKSDAQIATHAQIQALQQKMRNSGDPVQIAIASDEGWTAIAHGYDAYHTPVGGRDHYFIVLNRTALRVDKKIARTSSESNTMHSQSPARTAKGARVTG